MNIAIAGLALSAALFTIAPASAATVVTSIQIKNLYGVSGQSYIQIAELQAFAGALNVATQGTASATSVYLPGGNNAAASFANDGDLNGTYPSIYHGNDANGNDVFTLTLAAPTSIDSISIFGRTDCCGFRDVYGYSLFNGSRLVQSGKLDASKTGSASVLVDAVPEPATWAMMLVGFGMMGAAMRYRRRSTTTVYA